jgi:integrase
MIALKWSNVDFEMRCITVREGRVLGVEGPPKTMSSYRDIDMLDPLFEALRKHRQEAPAGATYVFPGKTGRPLEVNNLRKRAWYPAIASAGLRRRTMYQTRHTFASLMLGHGEDPLWVEPNPDVGIPLMIRKIRKELGLSQKDVAHRLHIAYQSYQAWENPKIANPTLKQLSKLADAVGKKLTVELV